MADHDSVVFSAALAPGSVSVLGGAVRYVVLADIVSFAGYCVLDHVYGALVSTLWKRRNILDVLNSSSSWWIIFIGNSI